MAMLIQTDKFGTSMAQALRTHAEVSRTKRRQRAEEKAGRMASSSCFPAHLACSPPYMLRFWVRR